MARDQGKSISARLNKAEVMITNARAEGEIMEAVSKMGYTSERLNRGKALFDSATARKNVHVALAGAQKEATAAARAAKKTAVGSYQEYSALAKGALKKSKESLAKLGLNSPMPRSEAKIIEAGKTLFENARSDAAIKAAMLMYGYDDARLEGEKAKILAFEKADAGQRAAEGAAQNSTDDQEKTMDELD